MDRHKKSRELFKKFLNETSEKEFYALISSLDSMGIDGPSVYEYFDTIAELAFNTGSFYVGGDTGDFLDMETISESFAANETGEINPSPWDKSKGESFEASESNYAMAA